MREDVDTVFFDVGGPIYDDVWYARALLEGLRELGAEVAEEDFWREYDRCRQAQDGLRRPLAARFLGDAADLRALSSRAEPHWRYPPAALYPDVHPVLERLGERYRLGVLANQPAAARAALQRDGIAAYFDIWVLSDEVGLEKPDSGIFDYAVRMAGCGPSRIVYVGNRLDKDIRPARAAGLRTVWILRGEASPEPTTAELGEADAAIESLTELPAVLEQVAAGR